MGYVAMNDCLQYKGYKGSVEYDGDDGILFGKVLFIDSLLMYHGDSISEIKTAFHETVDRYLEHCKKNGKSPNKPYGGSFNVRVGADRHKALAEAAYRLKASINDLICQSVDSFLQLEGNTVVVNHHHHHEISFSMLAENQMSLVETPIALEQDSVRWTTTATIN